MAEQDLHTSQVPIDFPASVGQRLRNAREALRLSRADIAARTKIAERHLAAIEEERFSDLASSTYAVGFSRAYARAVGLDEREIAQAVRGELDMVDEAEAPAKPTFEPGDPARVPSLRIAWVAGAAALAVIAGVIAFWGSYIFPAVSLPDLIKDTPPPPTASAKPVAAPTPTPAAQGPVVITATQAGAWVKITDANGKQLFQKEMALGESYTVPADATDPQLRTAWPDALRITIGGQQVAPLAYRRTVITAPVSAAALLARGAPSAAAAQPAPPAPSPSPAPSATPVRNAAPAAAAPTPAATGAARPAATPRTVTTPAARPTPAAPQPTAAASNPAPRASQPAPQTSAPAAAPTPAASPAPPETPKASTVSQ